MASVLIHSVSYAIHQWHRPQSTMLCEKLLQLSTKHCLRSAMSWIGVWYTRSCIMPHVQVDSAAIEGGGVIVWPTQLRLGLTPAAVQLLMLSTCLCMCWTAVGCANLQPPTDAWVERTGDRTTVSCNKTSQSWHLVCKGTTWVGPHTHDCRHGQSVTDYLSVRFISRRPQQNMLVVAGGSPLI